MSVSLVLTVISPDRPGLIEALSESVASHQGSWVESRMARLDGKFAGILRVRVPENRVEALSLDLRALEPRGMRVVIARSEAISVDPDARLLRLELLGSDRPGIIREISAALASRGINVDELRTEVVSAPMSGELLFRASAELWVPPTLDLERLRKDLEALAHELMVDIDLDEAI
jgi:glycine cleavage system regulatory protein